MVNASALWIQSRFEYAITWNIWQYDGHCTKTLFFEQSSTCWVMPARKETSPLATDYSTIWALPQALLLVCCTSSAPHHPRLSFVALFVWNGYELGDVWTVLCRQSEIVKFGTFVCLFVGENRLHRFLFCCFARTLSCSTSISTTSKEKRWNFAVHVFCFRYPTSSKSWNWLTDAWFVLTTTFRSSCT